MRITSVHYTVYHRNTPYFHPQKNVNVSKIKKIRSFAVQKRKAPYLFGTLYCFVT